jgi:hypothetical protein
MEQRLNYPMEFPPWAAPFPIGSTVQGDRRRANRGGEMHGPRITPHYQVHLFQDGGQPLQGMAVNKPGASSHGGDNGGCRLPFRLIPPGQKE